jgi:hypothetical protein
MNVALYGIPFKWIFLIVFSSGMVFGSVVDRAYPQLGDAMRAVYKTTVYSVAEYIVENGKVENETN